MRGAYLALLLFATLSSLRLGGPGLEGLGPALHPSLSPSDVVDGAQDLALLAGWGLVWMITAPPGRSVSSLRNAVLSGACVSALVEGVQLFSTTRTASVLDILTNTAGALLGAVALVVLVVAVAQRREARSFVGLPALVFAGGYGTATFAEAFVPLFRQTVYPNVYGGPLGRFRLASSMFAWSSLGHIPFPDIVLFAPAGALAVATLVEAGRGYRWAVSVTAAAGLALSVVAEVGHGFLGLPMEAGAVLAHALGVATGALATAWGLPRLTRTLRGRARPAALLLAYGGMLLLWALRPYVAEPSLDAIRAKLVNSWWIPLRFLGARMDMLSVVDVMSPFLLYLPLGGLLAVWPLARRGALARFWPAVYFAIATEVAQVVVQGRLLDSTDILVQVSSVVVGWVVLRRAGFAPHGTVIPSRG